MSQNPLNLIGLLNLDTNPNGIDRWFNEDLFIFIAGNIHWIENDFSGSPFYQHLDKWEGGGLLSFDFGDIVPFNDLAGEVLET